MDRLASVQAAAAEITVVEHRNVVWAAVAVHTEDSGIYCKLIPADQKLLEVRIVDIVCHETADIGCYCSLKFLEFDLN